VRWGRGTQSSDLLEVDKKFFGRIWLTFIKIWSRQRTPSPAKLYAVGL
jgi:hypothetical protein